MDKNSGKLIVVPTPIGNMGDMTIRAQQALAECDEVLAEDTRVTGKLLSALGIKKPIMRMDEAAITKNAQRVLDDVIDGKTLAFCSDAGMPGVSDPGMRLVRLMRENGVDVEVLPGPSAAVTAYVSSGVENPHFFFGAFLPKKSKALTGLLDSLAHLDAALVFYESPNRVVKSLECIASVFPTRQVCVCRELTKMHEEIVSGLAPEIFSIFAEREMSSSIKGEIAIVIDGPKASDEACMVDMHEQAKIRIAELLQEGMRSKEAASTVASEIGISKKDAYEIVLSLKEKF